MESEYLTSTRLAYEQLCLSYRAIDDFRAKLLGFLPLVTGGGLTLLTRNEEDMDVSFFGPVGGFGLLVTFGLLSYEIHGIRKCHALILSGRELERRLGLRHGQFIDRPRDVAGLVNEPFAAAVIYPATMAAWAYLAVYDRPEDRMHLARSVFILGFSLMLAYNFWLKWGDQLKNLAARLRPDRSGTTGSEPR